MTDKSDLLDRLAQRRPATTVVDEEPDSEDDCGAYGFLRGTRDRAIMIDFRRKDGTHEAFPYATLERVIYDPAEGMTLKFLGAAVILRGRNLATPNAAGISFLEAIHRQRVPWVREVEELRGAFLPDRVVAVTSIAVVAARDAEWV